MKYYVYIIQSEINNKFYIGQTQNINQRLEFHNTGRSIYTRNHTPWILYASNACDSRSEAIKWERKLKNLRSRLRILEFIQKNSFKIY